MGEMTYGVARGMKNFIMITLGTGVGSGIVVNGQVVYGSDGFAGELGHVIIDRSPEARQCGCGRKGCLEAYCSATGIVRTAREMLIKDARPSKLRSLNPDDITGLDVSVAAKDGDELAIDILRYTGRLLGQACANFALFCSPEAFVFFGGPTKSGELLMKHVREAYDEDILYVYKGQAKIILSGLSGSDAAVLGASALGWEL
jgi:glucokinase